LLGEKNQAYAKEKYLTHLLLSTSTTKGKKMKTLLGLLLILVTSCSTYKPIIDTKGRAGTWNEARAVEITDDIQHCTMLADQHITTSMEIQNFIITNILRPASFGVVSLPEDTKKNYIKACLKGRNHNVIN